jgi:hypothetical protein
MFQRCIKVIVWSFIWKWYEFPFPQLFANCRHLWKLTFMLISTISMRTKKFNRNSYFFFEPKKIQGYSKLEFYQYKSSNLGRQFANFLKNQKSIKQEFHLDRMITDIVKWNEDWILFIFWLWNWFNWTFPFWFLVWSVCSFPVFFNVLNIEIWFKICFCVFSTETEREWKQICSE